VYSAVGVRSLRGRKRHNVRRISFERFTAGGFGSGSISDIIAYLNKMTEKLNELSREVYKNREEENGSDKNRTA